MAPANRATRERGSFVRVHAPRLLRARLRGLAIHRRDKSLVASPRAEGVKRALKDRVAGKGRRGGASSKTVKSDSEELA